MSATTKRLTVGAGVTLAAALAVSGCQSSQQATDTSAAQPAAAPRAGAQVDGKDLAGKLQSASLAAKSVRVSLTGFGESAAIGSADLAFVSPQRTDLQVSATDAPGKQLRMVDGTVYLSAPQGVANGGKPWVSASQDSQNPYAKAGVQLLQQALRQAPTAQAGIVARSKVTTVGSEKVNGVDATRYRLATPLGSVVDQLAKGLPASVREDPEAGRMLGMVRQMTQGVTVTQDLWVDGGNRPLRLELTVPDLLRSMGQGAGGQGSDKAAAASGEKVTLTYSRWGAPVQIAAPPAAQTQPVEDAWGDQMPRKGGSPA